MYGSYNYVNVASWLANVEHKYTQTDCLNGQTCTCGITNRFIIARRLEIHLIVSNVQTASPGAQEWVQIGDVMGCRTHMYINMYVHVRVH